MLTLHLFNHKPHIWSNVWSNLHKLTARPQHTNSNRPPQKPPQKHKLKAQQKPSTPLEKTSHHKPLRKKKHKNSPKKHHEPLRTPNFSTSFDGQHSQGTLRPLRRARYPGGLRCRSSSAAAAPKTSAEASPVGGKNYGKTNGFPTRKSRDLEIDVLIGWKKLKFEDWNDWNGSMRVIDGAIWVTLVLQWVFAKTELRCPQP